MKIAFLTEMILEYGMQDLKVPAYHPNMRTEFAWMHALEADHHTITEYSNVKDYDAVIVIFPKGRVFLDAAGSKLLDLPNPVSNILTSNFIETLKQNNRKVYYMQEGPHWWFNNYELVDQINFYNMVASCDAIFAHNESDMAYYKGVYPEIPVHVMPTLMIDDIIQNIVPTYEDKAIIGGNFAKSCKYSL